MNPISAGKLFRLNTKLADPFFNTEFNPNQQVADTVQKIEIALVKNYPNLSELPAYFKKIVDDGLCFASLARKAGVVKNGQPVVPLMSDATADSALVKCTSATRGDWDKQWDGETPEEFLKRYNYQYEPPPGDTIAWYYPATYSDGDANLYGIYFATEKVLDHGADLCAKARETSGFIDANVANCVAILECYYHEVCHGWIEDLVYLAEPDTKKASGLYKAALYKFNSYIFLEEALCNSVAHGAIRSLFGLNKWIDTSKALIEASATLMRECGDGYKDFVDSWDTPPFMPSDLLFQQEAVRLLVEAYNIEETRAGTAVRNFFTKPENDGSYFKKHFDYPLHVVDQAKRDIKYEAAKAKNGQVLVEPTPRLDMF